MGQVQSEAVDEAQTQSEPQHSSSSPATSMESLLAEAAAYGDDENELTCEKAHVGNSSQRPFLCFLKSTSEEKGSDCVHPFVALQNCIKANPNAFSKDILDEDEDEVKKEEEPPPSPTYKIYPPLWSRGPQSPKSKL
ncbi:hypothetical protein Patl1_14951 [Pistacia atlantica]|uniref:Uncharacterized protein n=1 Tax=Pistacia atlantica TaxID=434234 RepID=A0ACC1B9J6_9ROSI|nr:hypothetical protein Patl1_14951 [Pistacia atlantica]